MYISGTYLVVVVVFQALSPGMWTVLEYLCISVVLILLLLLFFRL